MDSLAEARVEGDATRRSTALDAAIPVISVAEVRGAGVAAAQPPKARRGGHDLVLRHVAQALGEVPAMAEGVRELTMALAPEGLGELVPDRGARLHRARPRRIDVLDVQLQDRGRAADGQRRDDARVGELAGDMHDGVAELHLDDHHGAAGQRDTAALLRAEGRRVPVHGRRRVGDDEVDAELHAPNLRRAAARVLYV